MTSYQYRKSHCVLVRQHLYIEQGPWSSRGNRYDCGMSNIIFYQNNSGHDDAHEVKGVEFAITFEFQHWMNLLVSHA